MAATKLPKAPKLSPPLFTRKLTKTGNTRYLSVGAILPPDWIDVKIVVVEQANDHFILNIYPIR